MTCLATQSQTVTYLGGTLDSKARPLFFLAQNCRVGARGRELLCSWSGSPLKYPRESDLRKLIGKLFHNSAPL